MLAACAELIDELGYDGVTTTLIAERAGVAVGSLYQFFPDKRAVVQALTQQNLDHFLTAIHDALSDVQMTHWWEAADVVFDHYVQMHREVPAFSQIRFGDVVDLRLIDGQRENNTVIAEGLTALLAERFELPAEEISLRVSVANEIGDSVLNLAFRRKLFSEDVVLAEAKKVVRAYLSGAVDRLAQADQTAENSGSSSSRA